MTIRIAAVVLGVATIALSGCGTGGVQNASAVTPLVLTGQVHGGQQPVAGAVIQLYAAATGGYASAATPLLTKSVTTAANGSFSITGDYTCPANAQVYLTATGGNPGLAAGTQNAGLAMMAALGSCSALTASTYININELTTIASVWPLARFMSGPANMGSSATNAAGLANAFASVQSVVNIAQGTLPGTTLPANASLPGAEINTLANILASCINSTGGAAGDQTACGKLFTAATPSGGSAPSDTLTAAVNIARNPGASLAALFALSSSSAPYQPSLTAVPQNFLIGINYTGGGLNVPKGIAVDAQNNIWLANSGNSTLTKLSGTGTPISPATGFTGGGLNTPSSLAVDQAGNVWAANRGGNSLSKFSSSGVAVTASPFTGGGLNQPSGISIDGNGDVWLANFSGNSVSEFSPAGAAMSPAAGFTGAGINQPVGIAVNPH